MATQNNIHLPDDLFVELQANAASAGTTADDMAAEAIRRMIEKRKWAEFSERAERDGRPRVDPVQAVRDVRNAPRGR
jgi:hypothetical protein